MIQDLGKISSSRATWVQNSPGPGRINFKIFSGRADSISIFSRAGPTRSQNSLGPGWVELNILSGRAKSERKFLRAGPSRANLPGPEIPSTALDN